MPDVTASQIHLRRITMAAIGLAAGICVYAIVEVLPEAIANGRLLLAISSAGLVLFAGTLAMTGPITPGRAAAGAAALALAVSGLLVWASFRFDDVGAFLETGHPPLAAALLVAVALPFWIASSRDDAWWNDYEVLFDEAWRIVVRLVVAALFSGIVWAVIGLSDALLRVVGIDAIDRLLSIEVVPYALTGVIYGLALAVTHEFGATVTPYLPLRLLRLILPVLVAVTGLFLAALPFRGLANLFGDLSAGSLLIGVSMTGIALVAIGVDRRDDLAIQPGMLRISARIMALFLPLMGGLALWSVVLRVGQYGWSPDRVVAALAASVCTVYGLAYALSALSGRRWMSRIRAANTFLALALAGTAALLLTPLLNPQGIAARDQVSRFVEGRTDVEALDLWSIQQDWGRAGAAAITRMTALDHAQRARLAERIASLERALDRGGFEGDLPPAARDALEAELRSVLLVRPEGATIPDRAFDDSPPADLEDWRTACERRTPAGTPGCVAVVADLLPEEPGDEVMLATLSGGSYVRITALVPARIGRADQPTELPSAGAIFGDLGALSLPQSIDALAAGAFTVAPVPLNALRLESGQLMIAP